MTGGRWPLGWRVCGCCVRGRAGHADGANAGVRAGDADAVWCARNGLHALHPRDRRAGTNTCFVLDCFIDFSYVENGVRDLQQRTSKNLFIYKSKHYKHQPPRHDKHSYKYTC